MPLIPALRRQAASLSLRPAWSKRASSSTAKSTQRNPVLKNKLLGTENPKQSKPCRIFIWIRQENLTSGGQQHIHGNWLLLGTHKWMTKVYFSQASIDWSVLQNLGDELQAHARISQKEFKPEDINICAKLQFHIPTHQDLADPARHGSCLWDKTSRHSFQLTRLSSLLTNVKDSR